MRFKISTVYEDIITARNEKEAIEIFFESLFENVANNELNIKLVDDITFDPDWLKDDRTPLCNEKVKKYEICVACDKKEVCSFWLDNN